MQETKETLINSVGHNPNTGVSIRVLGLADHIHAIVRVREFQL